MRAGVLFLSGLDLSGLCVCPDLGSFGVVPGSIGDPCRSNLQGEEPALEKGHDHVVVTVVGLDKVGIVAKITGLLARHNVNIIDISQTLMGDLFTMIMLVDAAEATLGLDALRKRLEALSKRIGVQIVVQHERVFRFMHRI
jgi:ACT domain-containing protein